MAAFTSKDVARIAGVSQSTVSYVMTGKRPISERTRKRVLDAMEQLTYEPHSGARALAGRRTQVVGLVVPFGADGQIFGLLPFIETIASSARAHDHEVLLVTADEGSAGLRRLAGRALCDAIIMMDIEEHDDRVPVAAALPVPVVLIGVPADPAGLHCVDLDFETAARMAVDELADTAHDEIVVLGYPASAMERGLNFVGRVLRSARQRARARGVPLTVIEPVEHGQEATAEAVDQLLARRGGGRLGVVLPHNDSIGPILRALRTRDVLPGRDISVIGISPDPQAEESDPAYTNVSEEPRDVSRRAMETLFWLLDPAPGVERPGVDLVAPRLIRRSTVMPIPSN
ncbi:LacI family DNA-binding transcriptional regulator [Phytohabitans aurantiacus]|jgi:DNA-binding LacI/PurR family transcriptional regulator|uniref:LacI family transcriptional regulator n=1 Tax=Phytohabitans aurantiacus TaxID=3016789 RepID=A0ABQ5QP15_9ACTN|nr:LacI family DNA-binding transcriptional regulator [Phytohabitans aurantiacus]GLH96313.1 LacI family transcriptional regulator [Phytohabitans aurantiacus]